MTHYQFTDEDDPEWDGGDCELCAPPDDGDPCQYPPCCGCGADGSSERPDCICD